MSLLDSLPHRCSIARLVRGKDELGGSEELPVVERENVECWEQQAAANEVNIYQARGMKCSRKVYFNSNPQVTERHEITITKRRDDDGVLVDVPEDEQLVLTVVARPEPDASVGTGLLYRVMCDDWSALR